MDIEVYCDESRQECFRLPPAACKDQYVLLGSLWIETSLRGELKSKIKDKSVFSWNRAERIDWIAAALADRSAELYAGWDRNKKKIDKRRRVALVFGDYVVVLHIYAKKKSATFITAYIADSNTVATIRKSPRWV